MKESEAQTPDVEGLRFVDAEIEAAHRSADVEVLRSLVDDDFRFISGHGGVQSKSEWLAGLQSRRLSLEAKNADLKTEARAAEAGRGTVLLLTGMRVGEETEYDVEVSGDIGITNCLYAIQNEDGSESCLRYLRVYRHKNERWWLTSHRYIHSAD